MTLRNVLLNLGDEELGDMIIELVPEQVKEFCFEVMKRKKDQGKGHESFDILRQNCEKEINETNNVDDLFYNYILHQIKLTFERLINWEQSSDIGTNVDIEKLITDNTKINQNYKKRMIEKRGQDVIDSEIENNKPQIEFDQLLPPFLLMFNTINTEIPNINSRWALDLNEDLVPGGPTRDKSGYLIHNWRDDIWLSWYDDLRSHRVLSKRAVTMMRRFFPTFESLLAYSETQGEQQEHEGVIHDTTRVIRLDDIEDFQKNEGDIKPFFVYYFGMMMIINVVFRQLTEQIEKGDLMERLWQMGVREFSAKVIRRAILTNTIGSYRFGYLLTNLNAVCMYFTMALARGEEGFYNMSEINSKIAHCVKWNKFNKDGDQYFNERFQESINMLAMRTMEAKTFNYSEEEEEEEEEEEISRKNNYIEKGLNNLKDQMNYETTIAIRLLSNRQIRPNNFDDWPPFIPTNSEYFDRIFNTFFNQSSSSSSSSSIPIPLSLPFEEFIKMWNEGKLEGNVTKSDFRHNKKRLYFLEYAYLNTLINNKRKTPQLLVYPLERPIPDDIFKIEDRGWTRLTELNMIVDQMQVLFSNRSRLSKFDDIKGKIECQRPEIALRIVCPEIYDKVPVFGIDDTSQFETKKIARPLSNEDLIRLLRATDSQGLFANNVERSQKLHDPLSSIITAKVINDEDLDDICILLGIDEDTDELLLSFYLRFCLLDTLIAYLIGEKEEEQTMLNRFIPFVFDDNDNSVIFTAKTIFENLVGIYS